MKSTYKIFGSDCKVSADYVVYRDNEVVRPNAEGLVFINFHGTFRYLYPRWLFGIAYFGFDTPDVLTTHQVIFVDIPTKSTGVAATPVVSRPKYWIEDRSYRHCPLWWRVVVNREGVIRNAHTGKIIEHASDQRGYLIASSMPGREATLSVHRVVASAWVHNPDPCTLFVVNHLDGNPGNPNASNLEWTTHKGNNDHAVATALNVQAIRLRLRSRVTGVVTEHNSITEACVFAGLNRTYSAEMLEANSRRNYLLNDLYEVRIGNDDRPWHYANVVLGPPKARYRIVLKDGDTTTTYNGSKEIRRNYALWNLGSTSWPVIREALKARYPHVEILVDEDLNPWVGVEVKDETTGEVSKYQSATDAANNLGMHRSKVINCMQSKGTRIYDGKRFRPTSDKPWPTIDRTSEIPSTHQMEVTNKHTGEVVRYPTLRSAARELNLGRSVIMRMMNSPKHTDPITVKKLA